MRYVGNEKADAVVKPTLVLDLDGTLIRNDLTFELFALCARWNPVLFVYAVYKAITDRASAKRLLAARYKNHIDPSGLPYRPEILALAELYKNQGHPIELVSGSDEAIVKSIAQHLHIDFYKGSVPGTNLTSARKAQFLKQRHGENFLYAGNSRSDYAVWRAGLGGYGINAPERSYHLKRDNGSPVQVSRLGPRRREISALIRGLRLHQWAKNLLIFIVPAIQISHLTLNDALSLFLAFLCFSALASATYLLNDLFDIQDDRKHRRKAKRPLANGDLSVPFAIWSVLLTIPAGLFFAFFLNSNFGWVCIAYLIGTGLYTLCFKRIAVGDVFTLAGLFSMRVIAGAFIIEYPPSGWLLTFIGTFFLSLAIGKRFVEVLTLEPGASVPGRGYQAVDSIPLLAMGAASGVVAVMAMLIYGLSAPITVFKSEIVVLLGSTLLLAWVLRFWLLAGRGEISDDPVVYAVKDKTSLALLTCISAVFAYDLTGPMWQSFL